MSGWFSKIRNPLFGILSTGCMILIIALLTDRIIMPIYTAHGHEKELPDITEMTVEEAEKILDDMGFQLIRDKQTFSSVYPEGTVVAQNPSPFAKVKKGRRIYVTVSVGERLVEMPRLTGYSEDNAIFSVREANLQLGQVFYQYNGYYPNGVVCEQSIPERETIVENTQVDITISLGRVPSRFEVPDIVGKSLALASEVIKKEGLEVGEIRYEVQPKLLPDTVIEQSIAPGTEVKQGEKVDLVLSRLEDLWIE